MKNFAKGLLAVTVSLVVFPMLMSLYQTLTDGGRVASWVTVPINSDKVQMYKFVDTVNIYDTDKNCPTSMYIEDFLIAAVLGSVSPEAEEELLKAQTVLMYTYILERRAEERSEPSTELFGCDISTDEVKYVRLVTWDKAYELYGDKAWEYYQRIRLSVLSVLGEYIAYDGKPIATAYCFSCGGVTESAANVLGEDVPYLKSVESVFDSDYVTEAAFSSDEIFAKLSLQEESITLLGSPENWIELVDVSETGYVKNVLLDKSYLVSGKKLAKWLGLPSARFSLTYSEEFDRFNFKIYGSGHLLGLSQYGANKMAASGYDYTEILKHYFTGVEIKKT